MAEHQLRRARRGPLPVLTFAIITAFTAVSCDAGMALSAVGNPGAAPAAAPTGSAADALAGLAVKGRAPKTGYARDAFRHWSDLDGDGCDTRQEILERDAVTSRAGRDGCVVSASVVVADPYSGADITGGSELDIDHVVALSDAWQKGADAGHMDDATRERFANDPLNLLAVDDGLNQQKGDGDAATWLPPNKAYRCAYVARQVAVKAAYRLWVTAPERDAVARVLDGCPGQPLPTR